MLLLRFSVDVDQEKEQIVLQFPTPEDEMWFVKQSHPFTKCSKSVDGFEVKTQKPNA